MRVLVTGGAGYIGSVIVEELVKAGHTPVVYDSLVKGRRGALAPDVPLVEGDVRETKHVRRVLDEHRIDAVIHMGALIEVGLSVTLPHTFFENNVGGSLSVLRAMIDAGVKKYVFSSTAALYGDPERLPITEDEPARPTNPYGESKLMVEQMLRWDAPAHGITATSLRYFNAAGATDRNGEMHEPETHLIPLVLASAAASRPVKIFGTDYPTRDGTPVRDYVHVVDLAQAHLLALHRDEPGLRIYNVGNGNGYSVREVIATAREVTGLPLPVEELPRREGDQIATVASSERIRRELGWEPRHADLHDILGSAWRWRQTHPHGYEE
ncbi:MAG TPA: UDP-glucose 4-epimerase GalE [Ktedonobacterales bacterium]